ncbi:putative phytol kinase 2, chloroplastic [Iris pallida]|uniref:Phytol kinase 2, chloroplastic n=1 Tax=Iris pallida TaxID=29817 RepID=A0AAX6GRW9_IRIPA|nr:putative phytol kinase 2, chloroplastic [Iris pallida]
MSAKVLATYSLSALRSTPPRSSSAAAAPPPPLPLGVVRRPYVSFEHRRPRIVSASASMLPESQWVHDAGAAAVTAGAALGLLKFWEEVAKRGFFDQKLNRKLVHISIGMAFMLFWPLFSSGWQAPFLAAVAPGINIIRMLLMGLGIWKNEAMVKSISRNGDYRELLKGPLYYACTITLATSIFWRTSPIAIAAISNLCAGDGIADIVGRRFGKTKLPYNPNKSLEGSVAMAIAGFIASITYMHYYSTFGFVEESLGMTACFLLVSLVASFVESLPISSELDDNLTVPLTSLLVGGLVF